uniref:Uncharacterized protein n=1 Tax=Ananas comosus var. bracteatus TaxID=296719 RepID=A0A6V7NMJ4_ANACO|nr:unnamed protein product [Ananas comosus var. bracteatus]
MWGSSGSFGAIAAEMDTPSGARSERRRSPSSRGFGGFRGFGGVWMRDSPVFNFINSLSPIQTVKSIDSVQSIQAYQSLNFASIPSIFTSPHANTQRDSKLSARNPFKELSEQETSSVTCLLNEALVDPPDDSSIVPTNLPQPLQFDGGSPNHSTTPRHGAKTDHAQSNLDLFQSSLDKRKSLFALKGRSGKSSSQSRE